MTARCYEIRVQGHLDGHWAAWFTDLAVHRHGDGTSTLVGFVTDQAELHGVLARVRDLGVPLISVTPVPDPGPVAGQTPRAYGDGIPRGGSS